MKSCLMPAVPHCTVARRSLHTALTAAALAVASLYALPANASPPYRGELLLFGNSYCPQGWLPADGRLLAIADHQHLFALLGTAHGGDGTTTFGLPDLRARAAVGAGTGHGLSPLPLGKKTGRESVTLEPKHVRYHTHTLPASTQGATHAAPVAGRIPAAMQNGGVYAASGGASVGIAVASAAGSASPEPLDVRSPFIALQWCIAVDGKQPSEN